MLEPFIRSVTVGRLRFVVRRDDNWVDRLNSRATVILLVACGILIGLAQWVRKPISCWFPKNFDVVHREYLHAHCWVMPFYYLPYTHQIPKVHEDQKRRLVLYYQWIPWILITQAFFFWLPSAVWHWLCERSSLNPDVVLSMAESLNSTKNVDKKEQRVALLARYMDYILTHGDERGRCGGRRLILSYLGVKILYIGNLLLQTYVLGLLLTTDYRIHLINYVNFQRAGVNATEDGQLWNSPMFPRIAFCDYIIRALGNNRRYTAQCVLPLNIYLERLYLFFWIWVALLLLLTATDLLAWIVRFVVRLERLHFVDNPLGDVGETADFLDGYLRQDGAFVLRLIAHNTSDHAAADVTSGLWQLWRSRRLNEGTRRTSECRLELDDCTTEAPEPTPSDVIGDSVQRTPTAAV